MAAACGSSSTSRILMAGAAAASRSTPRGG
jgi:hypothetical protein